MVNVEHNSELDDLAKDGFLPEGFGVKHPHVDALAVDRSKTAKNVYDNVEDWQKAGTNKSDLLGFDTKTNPKTSEKATRRLLYDMGTGYLEQEPSRFLRFDQVSYKLLKQHKDEILDFQSFKDVLRKAWAGDNGLSVLISDKYAKESDFKALFEQDLVQSWLNTNIENIAVPVIMRKLNIEEVRAKQVYSRLPARKRGVLLSRILKGKKITLKRKVGTVKPILVGKGVQAQVRFLKQVRGNTEYQRTFPKKWSEMETNFIRNNKSRGRKWILEYYNRIFSERSKGSIQNKFYRVK